MIHMNAEKQTPALAHFVGAYYHADWADEFNDDEWAAVDSFISGSAELASELPREIAHVLTAMPSDDDVARFLLGLGCYYTTTPEDGGYREWLTEVASRVAAATSQRGGGPNSR